MNDESRAQRLRACLHGGGVPRLTGLPGLGGLKHSTPLHATQLSGIGSGLSFAWLISTTNKMADKRDILVASLILFSLVPLADAFQCLGLLFCTLLIERNHQRQLTLKAALEYNSALAKLRHIRRRVCSAFRTDFYYKIVNPYVA